ncbi:hypothetical protein Poli38472_001783 [Pythium oligandrum]|uniref:Cell division control protein 45 n=1 Tax=Pythium oligandrum TaxID=41045 RepID=A0A8K1CVF1_PYTOL|nr:hypothetical protein Poli38472_001783 [Pythium oligandrum]|eukprot:TMW69627.1 hypothetical protein Poli38472_001783 [Pythium oligandrum]
MLWPREEFHAAYGQIKHDGIQSGGSSILILVALDVDALCACEILTTLFKADFLSYTLLPVRGYEDIIRIRDARIRDADGNVRASELRSIVMLNCGAIVNVTQLLALPSSVKCYIFDSHRPIHLANIYDTTQQIVVFDDGAQSIEDFPADGSDIENDEFEESDEEEGEDDGEEDDEEDREEEEEVDEDEGEAEVDFGVTQPQDESGDGDDERETEKAVDSIDTGSVSGSEKKRKRDDDETDVSMSEPVEEMDEDDTESPAKRFKDVDAVDIVMEPEQASAKVLKRKRREEILRYYRGSFNGAPAATIAFELAQQMNSSRRDLLWCAIVGLTKQFVLEEIDADNYNLMIHRFQDEVLALDTSAVTGATESNDGVINPAYDHGRISFEEEYRFMCYRHWSLYEAMYYSDYIAAKLGLYMDQARRFGARNAANGSEGETTLHVFLARMGFSLRQSQQKFAYMPLEMKQQLREKIQEMAPEFGLKDVFYGSFKRQFAFQYQLCAADAVYGLQALLEAPESYITAVFQAENHHHPQQKALTSTYHINSNGITPVAQKNGEDAADKEDDQSAEDNLQDFKHQNFFLAHTALSCRSVESSALMESGIKVSMELKQAIVRVGISIMERKLIVRVKHFRYVSLHIPEREQQLFANASVLTQLALFLLNVHRASGKWGGQAIQRNRKTKNDDGEAEEDEEEAAAQKPIVPLVLITRNPAQNCFMVVGITCPTNPGEVHRNTLGTAFRLAAGETGANFRQDGFTSAVLEIQMDDIHYFVEQLHNVMDA